MVVTVRPVETRHVTSSIKLVADLLIIKAKKMRSQADNTSMNSVRTAHDVAQQRVWPPPCLHALPTSRHAPDETTDGLPGDLLPDVDSLCWCGGGVVAAVDPTIRHVSGVLDWIQVWGNRQFSQKHHWPHRPQTALVVSVWVETSTRTACWRSYCRGCTEGKITAYWSVAPQSLVFWDSSSTLCW